MSQGLSADYVELHKEVPCLGKLCSVGRGKKLDNSYRLASALDMFDPALLAIAISRVMSPSGIYVMHEVSSEATRYASQCHNYSWVNCFQFVISDVYSFTDSENEEYMFPNERKQVAENPQPSTSKVSTSSNNTIIIKDLLLKQTTLAPA